MGRWPKFGVAVVAVVALLGLVVVPALAQETSGQSSQGIHERGGSFRQRLHQGALAQAMARAANKTVKEIRELKKGKTWEQVAQSLGLDFKKMKSEAGKLLRQRAAGLARERRIAAFLARKSGKTLQEIRELKAKDKTWAAVAQELGIAREDLAKALTAWRDGRVRNSAVVAFLSKLTGKPAKDILALKHGHNTWVDVARALGVGVNH